MEQSNATTAHLIGKRVLVRTRISGVSIGIARHIDPATCTIVLDDAVRIWSWSDAFTVSEIATTGAECRLATHGDGVVISDEGFELHELADTAWTNIEERATYGAQ